MLAADMGGMGFIENNKALCMLTVLTSTHMLQAARDHGVERYFYSSSACVYAADKQTDADITALEEADAYPAMPEDGYGWEKLFTERMCRHFLEDFGLTTRVARYHNVYGPHGTWTGGREKAPAAICRKVATAAITGEHRIEIWGDGEQTRSFMYIDDCVKGTQMILNGDSTEPVNLGSSELVTINRLVDIVEGIAGIRCERDYELDAPQGVRGRNSDNTQILETYGWEPSITLVDGLEQTYALGLRPGEALARLSGSPAPSKPCGSWSTTTAATRSRSSSAASWPAAATTSRTPTARPTSPARASWTDPGSRVSFDADRPRRGRRQGRVRQADRAGAAVRRRSCPPGTPAQARRRRWWRTRPIPTLVRRWLPTCACGASRWVLWHQDVQAVAIRSFAGAKLGRGFRAGRRRRRAAASAGCARRSAAVVVIADSFVDVHREWGTADKTTVIPNWAPLDEIVPIAAQQRLGAPSRASTASDLALLRAPSGSSTTRRCWSGWPAGCATPGRRCTSSWSTRGRRSTSLRAEADAARRTDHAAAVPALRPAARGARQRRRAGRPARAGRGRLLGAVEDAVLPVRRPAGARADAGREPRRASWSPRSTAACCRRTRARCPTAAAWVATVLRDARLPRRAGQQGACAGRAGVRPRRLRRPVRGDPGRARSRRRCASR